MEKKVNEFIKQHNLILDKPIIVAVSGGADSVSLLYVLKNLGYSLILAHVNHNKREASKIEEASMRDLAKELNISFELLDYHYSNLDNFQAEAHHARYNFFKSLCDKYNTNIIATAHHKDDQIETVLMKLMEGSNLYGYGGISILNERDGYLFVRPLLCVTKEEIYAYCKKNNLIYFEDSSNQEDDYLRNRLRHKVIPILKEECPSLSDKIMEYSIQLHEAFDYIREESISYLDKNNNKINLDSFHNLNIAVKKDILSLLLERSFIRKNNDIIDNMLKLLKTKDGNKELHLENNYRFVKSYNLAYISKGNIKENKEYQLDLGDEIIVGDYRFYLTKSHNNICANYINICYNDLVFPLTIRYRKDGDMMNIGIGNKRVSRILIDKKVPKEKRDQIPLVLDKNQNVLWVVGYQKSTDVSNMKDKGDIYLVCEVVK